MEHEIDINLQVGVINGEVIVRHPDLNTSGGSFGFSPQQARDFAATLCRNAALAEQQAPTPLIEVELFAYIGKDELGPHTYGLKQGITGRGYIPLVSTRRHRMEEHFEQMEHQAEKWGNRIRLCRYIFAGVVRTTKAGDDEPSKVTS